MTSIALIELWFRRDTIFGRARVHMRVRVTLFSLRSFRATSVLPPQSGEEPPC
jgi:hypothetical protein